jgi:Ca2+-binding RTX toxin-like protein
LATVDSRKIVFLERFLDDPFTQGVYGPYASGTANADLEAAFGAVFGAVKLRLLAQAHLSEAFGLGAFDYLADGFAGLDLAAVFGRAATVASALPGLAEKLTWWKTASPSLGLAAAELAVPANNFDTWLKAATRDSTGFALSAAELARVALLGTSAAETRTGTPASELLHGGAGNDTLTGAGGDDAYLFARGDGQDRITDNGGATDAIILGANILPADVTFSRTGTNSDDLVIAIAGGDSITVPFHFLRNVYGDYAYRIESLRFADGTVLDHAAILAILNTPTTGNDTLIGEHLSDTLFGAGGNDSIVGRSGDDILNGGAGADTLRGDAISIFGNDVLAGTSGNDWLDGGRGNDLYRFARGDGLDTISETGSGSDDGGDDTITFAPGILPSEVTLARSGTNGDDLVITIAGGDRITIPKYFGTDYWGIGSLRIEHLRFADGTTWTYQSIFAPYATGTAGHDTLQGDAYGNALNALDGNDLLLGRNGDDTLDGGLGADTLDGGNGLDRLLGGAGADSLAGGAGNDTLEAGAENDTLVGGAGADVLSGGAGADRYRLAVFTDSGLGPAADRILDFTPAEGDRIDLSAIDANATLAGDQAFSFLGTGAFVAGARGQLRHETRNDGNTWILGDIDGNALPDFEITLQGTLSPAAAAFLL